MSRYISTRGTKKEKKNFGDVLIEGMASDGGLYVPESWPSIDRAMMERLAGLPYTSVASQVMLPFIGTSIDHGATCVSGATQAWSKTWL